MAHTHIIEQDRVCPRCRMVIQAYIPHECDPTICKTCDGRGTIFVGRAPDRTWVGYNTCSTCSGTGRITFTRD